MQRLADTDRVTGPCAAFPFVSSNKTKNTPDKCKAHPELNPDTITKPEFYLSKFAHDWIDYTCCQIVTEPLNGIISSVWLWLQVCTKTMNTLQANSAKLLLQDAKFAETRDADILNKAQIYPDGPLKTMKRYCPQDLDGGELSEWVVTTFFPVCEGKGEGDGASWDVVSGCVYLHVHVSGVYSISDVYTCLSRPG